MTTHSRHLSGGGRLLALALASYFFVFFHRAAPSTLAHVLKSDFHLTNTEFGWLGSVYFYIYALMQLPTGIWVDRHGMKYTLIGGSLLSGIGSILFALSTTFFEAIITRAILGLGVSVILVSCLRLISVIYSPDRFSTYAGMVVAIGTLGAICAGLPLDFLLKHYSWRTIHCGIALICIALAGCLAYAFRQIPTPTAPVQKPGNSWTSQLQSVIHNPQTWCAFGVNFFVGSTVFGFSGLWAVRYLVTTFGANTFQATLALSCFFCGFGLGSALMGMLSTHLGRRKTPMYISAFGSIILTSLLAFGDPYPITVYDAIYFLLGFFGTSFSISWASSKENNAPDLAGMATSTANIGSFFGTALMQPLMGWLLDHVGIHLSHPFAPIFWAMLAAHLIGLACIAGIRETYCQNQTVLSS